MKFYSENTKKFYNTAKECEAADNEFLKEKEAKEKAEKEKKEQKAARAKEVEVAYEIAARAVSDANKKLNDFISDYGTFHCSKKTKTNSNENDIFDILFGGLLF